MDKLPVKVIIHIFQYLSKQEKLKVSKVNKKFREALFSPSLWTEHEKRLEVPASQMKSLREFLKQAPWLKYLNLLVIETESPSIVNLTSVFKPLINLECLTLQLYGCRPSETVFPSKLKHISLLEDGRSLITREACGSFITDNLLIGIANSCPQLEHIQIKSVYAVLDCFSGLGCLLKEVEENLQTLILSEIFAEKQIFNFYAIPPNITTLCLSVSFDNFVYEYDRYMVKLPNLDKLQILSLGSELGSKVITRVFADWSLKNLRFLHLDCWPRFDNEDFFLKLSKLPNLQVLYLNQCYVKTDVLVRFVQDCLSLKALVCSESGGKLNAKKKMSELKKIRKETPVTVCICKADYAAEEAYCNVWSNFSNESVDCPETFHHLFSPIFDFYFFQCHAPYIKKFLLSSKNSQYF